MLLPMTPPALTAPAVVAAVCTGSDLTIVKVVPSRSVGPDHVTYTLRVTVTNAGAGQRGNVLQSIVMMQNGEKTDVKGVPPLGPGRSYTYAEHFVRALGSQTGTTDFRFIPERESPPLGAKECLGAPFSLAV